MLVIRPNHKSGKISLAQGLKKWAQVNVEDEVNIPEEYQNVFLIVKQISREVYIESMSKARSASSDEAGEGQLYSAMCDLVKFGIHCVEGLHDEDGPILINAGDDGLSDEDISLLGVNELAVDLWRVVKCYNEVSATEKKLFGEQVQLTSVA